MATCASRVPRATSYSASQRFSGHLLVFPCSLGWFKIPGFENPSCHRPCYYFSIHNFVSLIFPTLLLFWICAFKKQSPSAVHFSGDIKLLRQARRVPCAVKCKGRNVGAGNRVSAATGRPGPGAFLASQRSRSRVQAPWQVFSRALPNTIASHGAPFQTPSHWMLMLKVKFCLYPSTDCRCAKR